MTKRLIEIDDELLQEARRVTGERTMRGTVEAGLHLILSQEAGLKHLARLRDKETFELTSEEMKALRNPW